MSVFSATDESDVQLRLRYADPQGDRGTGGQAQEVGSRDQQATALCNRQVCPQREPGWCCLVWPSESRAIAVPPPTASLNPFFHLLPVWNSVLEELSEACS